MTFLDEIIGGHWLPIYENEQAYLKTAAGDKKIKITDNQYLKAFNWFYYSCRVNDVLCFDIEGITYKLKVKESSFLNIKFDNGYFICCNRNEFWIVVNYSNSRRMKKIYPFMIKKITYNHE
jgi:hypothetical protein